MQSPRYRNDTQMVHTHGQTSVRTGRCYGLWNQAVHTDREVMENRPDIKIKNKKEKTCKLIEVEIPADRNIV